MKKLSHLYSGKAKTLYRTEDENYLIVNFRDDTSAFDGEKLAKLTNKGIINNHISAYIMQYLQDREIPTHFVQILNDNESIVKNLEMLPIECVVRNYAAGSICRRLGIEEGLRLSSPLFEFFLKNDALHDPMINESHILTFGWAKLHEVEQMKQFSLRINEILMELFLQVGILLVDYKLEFGRYQGDIILGDEFTPDGCRLWDAKTRERLDKDRFRRDMGDVIEAYEIVADRLGVVLPIRC